MGKFEDRDFPDAVDSSTVGWMIVDWRIFKDNNRCEKCGGNYSLRSNQFDDLPVGTVAKSGTYTHDGTFTIQEREVNPDPLGGVKIRYRIQFESGRATYLFPEDIASIVS